MFIKLSSPLDKINTYSNGVYFPHCHVENIIKYTNYHPFFQLHELQDRNMECLGMLHESQEEIKELRSRSGPAAHLYFSQSCGAFSGVSFSGKYVTCLRKLLKISLFWEWYGFWWYKVSWEEIMWFVLVSGIQILI